MNRTLKRIVALCLGLWLALAPAVILGPAAAMTIQMGLSDTATGTPDCCPGGEQGRDACAPACMSTIPLTILPKQDALSLFVMRDRPALQGGVAVLGHVAAPDPPPPKTFILH